MQGSSLASVIQAISVWAIPVLLAVTIHEAAHGYAAPGRIFGTSGIPFRHIDPVGTVAVPLIMLFVSNFLFGWAKPVPVNPGNLNNPKRDMVLVAAAGPGANLVMALAWAYFARLATVVFPDGGDVALFFASMGEKGIIINVLLAVFNLIPLPPLDGGRVLRGLVPDQFGVLWPLLNPFFNFVRLLILKLAFIV